MHYLKEHGKLYSRPSYGCDIKACQLHESQHEQGIIAKIRTESKQGLLYRHIVAAPNIEGVPTKRGASGLL